MTIGKTFHKNISHLARYLTFSLFTRTRSACDWLGCPWYVIPQVAHLRRATRWSFVFSPCIAAWGFTPYASPTHCLFSIVIPPDGPTSLRSGRRPAGTGTSCSRHEVSPSLSLGCASEMRRIPALDYRAKQNLTFAFRKNRSPARFPRRNFASDPQSGVTLISRCRCL